LHLSRDSFIEKIACPICGGSIVPLDTGIAVFARIGVEPKQVGGLKAYRCRQYAHIFFLKAQDVEIFDNSETAPAL
jgi:hypothetical protein